MKLSFPGSIKGIVTFIVALAFMPALVLMIYSGYSGAQADIEYVGMSALRSVRNIARQQTMLVESTHMLLFTLSNLSEVRDGNEGCSTLFQNLTLYTPIYADIRLCDPEGNTVALSTPEPELLPALVAGQIRKAASSASSFSMQELPWEAGHNSPRINCLLPVSHNGRITGVLMASIIVHVPASELVKLENAPGEYLRIVDKKGNTTFVYPAVEGASHEEECTISSVWQRVNASPKGYGLIRDSEHEHIAFEKLFLEDRSVPELTVFLRISTSAIIEHMRTWIYGPQVTENADAGSLKKAPVRALLVTEPYRRI